MVFSVEPRGVQVRWAAHSCRRCEIFFVLQKKAVGCLGEEEGAEEVVSLRGPSRAADGVVLSRGRWGRG